MTDYAEEQAQEIEALQSIYPEEFEELESDGPRAFKITLKPDNYDQDVDFDGRVNLYVQYTATYPDEEAQVSLAANGDIADEQLEELRGVVQETSAANVGMVVVFTLASVVKEWLDGHLDSLKKQREEQREREEEERRRAEEAPKFHGTAVTRERFLEWKRKFEAEKEEEARKKAAKDFDPKKAAKLTGRQLFEQNKELAASDLADMEAGEEIDTTLFTEEALTSESDDDDYDPLKVQD
eukprot:Colp12_sorted_trinity150504_noHs@774